MSGSKIAREFFQFHLPKEIQKKIDLNTLEIHKESFLDDTLGVGIMDMLFSVKFGKEMGYLYLIVEHQKPDYWVSLKLYKYMLNIYEHHLEKYPKSKQLPLVYPMVFYTGQDKYTAPLDLWSLFAKPELAKSFFIETDQAGGRNKNH